MHRINMHLVNLIDIDWSGTCIGTSDSMQFSTCLLINVSPLGFDPGLCSTYESWVKFDSTLTQMSRVRVESVVKIKDMSRVRVESRWSSFGSELSQLDTAWVKVESMIFRGENVKILQLSVTLQRNNQPTATFDRTPPGQQRFPKLGKMWWVVSHIWLNSDSNELSQSWVRLANLGFQLSRSWVTWIVIWVRVESARKNESSTTLLRSQCILQGNMHYCRYPTRTFIQSTTEHSFSSYRRILCP